MNIFSGNSNLPLATKICKIIGTPLSNMLIKKFANGECYVEFPESVRNETAVLIQGTARSNNDIPGAATENRENSVNDNLMFELIAAHTLKINGAEKITLCSPYFAYARQDKKDIDARGPNTSAHVIELLKIAGVQQIITAEIHNESVLNPFMQPYKNVYVSELFATDIRQNYDIGNMIIVSPDHGGFVRARAVAKYLGNLDAVFCYKRRGPAATEANQVKEMILVGDVGGKDAVIVDDIADTCGTMAECVNLLYAKGAKSVVVYAAHGEFSGNALETIEKSPMKKLVTTDSIINGRADQVEKIRRISLAPLLAETISHMMIKR